MDIEEIVVSEKRFDLLKEMEIGRVDVGLIGAAGNFRGGIPVAQVNHVYPIGVGPVVDNRGVRSKDMRAAGEQNADP